MSIVIGNLRERRKHIVYVLILLLAIGGLILMTIHFIDFQVGTQIEAVTEPMLYSSLNEINLLNNSIREQGAELEEAHGMINYYQDRAVLAASALNLAIDEHTINMINAQRELDARNSDINV
jgi:hypothetical protein